MIKGMLWRGEGAKALQIVQTTELLACREETHISNEHMIWIPKEQD